MSDESQKIGLDNPVFRGRLRNLSTSRQAEGYVSRSGVRAYVDRSTHASFLQVKTAETVRPTEHKSDSHHAQITTRRVARAAIRAARRTNSNSGLQLTYGGESVFDIAQRKVRRLRERCVRVVRPKLVLQTMAVIVFIIGLSVSVRTEYANRQTSAQVSALSQQAENGGGNGSADVRNSGASDVPITTKPSQRAIDNYVVTSDLPRYLSISKLRVKARVLQVGVKTDGSLDTPRNIYDTGWYTGSAKPGRYGATVIDGHVQGFTKQGVFYRLKDLRPGDTMTIEKGDGQAVKYRVVQSQTYSAKAVDMQKVIKPITPGKSGLNLITCAGKVKTGTNDYTHRLVVFAEQI